MEKFVLEQRAHQIEWRKAKNISLSKNGVWQGKAYAHIIPKQLWEELLFSGIRKELHSYLHQKAVHAHTGTNNLLSSWVVCANLYFYVRQNEALKKMILEFFKQKISTQITEITEVEIEFSFPQGDALHPSALLGELDGSCGTGQTSPDVAFIVKTKDGIGIVLTECKFTEHSFYKCSARRTEDKKIKKGNPDPARCMKAANVCNYKDICHQTVWGRQYWNILDLSAIGNNLLKRCPAATAGYQLFRQQALAEGIMQRGNYSLVASSVAFDDRNTDLKNCLSSTGVMDFQTDWAGLFEGKVIFKTWTHQEWVQFVRDNQVNNEFDDWLSYLNERYGY